MYTTLHARSQRLRQSEIGGTTLDILATTDLAFTVLDRVIPLEGLVHEGLLAMSEGRARGKIVVDPRP